MLNNLRLKLIAFLGLFRLFVFENDSAQRVKRSNTENVKNVCDHENQNCRRKDTLGSQVPIEYKNFFAAEELAFDEKIVWHVHRERQTQ